jgi:hypothetical protein
MANKTVDLKAKAKKINYLEVLRDESIKDSKEELFGRSTGSTNKVLSYIVEKYEEANKEVYKTMSDKVNELISDQMASSIEKTVEASKAIEDIEKTLQRLNNKLRDAKQNNVNYIDIMSIELEITEKKEALEAAKKPFVELYKKALVETIIPEELSEIYNQACELWEMYQKEMDSEIEQRRAEIEALNLTRENLKVTDRFIEIIGERLNNYSVAVTAISCSRRKLPLIGAILNKK